MRVYWNLFCILRTAIKCYLVHWTIWSNLSIEHMKWARQQHLLNFSFPFTKFYFQPWNAPGKACKIKRKYAACVWICTDVLYTISHSMKTDSKSAKFSKHSHVHTKFYVCALAELNIYSIIYAVSWEPRVIPSGCKPTCEKPGIHWEWSFYFLFSIFNCYTLPMRSWMNLSNEMQFGIFS